MNYKRQNDIVIPKDVLLKAFMETVKEYEKENRPVERRQSIRLILENSPNKFSYADSSDNAKKHKNRMVSNSTHHL